MQRFCPSQCCRNVANSTIFRKLGNGFLSTPKVFWKLFWAFRHLRSPFWPFLCIFGSPESPRKLCREAPKCRFEIPTGGKMVQKLVFLENRQNQTLKQTFFPRTLWGLEKLRKGPEHVLTPNRHKYVYSKAQVCVPKGTKNWDQNPIPSGDDSQNQKSSKFQNFQSCAYVCIHLLWGGECPVLMFQPPKSSQNAWRTLPACFSAIFKKLVLGPLKVTEKAQNDLFDKIFFIESSVPMCADTFLGCNMISIRALDPKGSRNRFGNLLRLFRHYF